MKIRIILILLLFCPFVVRGQVTQSGVDKSSEETFKTVFYNTGKMFVGKNAAGSGGEVPSSIYVYGSAKVVDGSEIDQRGVTTITGDFINGQNDINAPKVFKESSEKGTIVFANPKSSKTENKKFQFPIGGTDPTIGKGTLAEFDFDLMYKQEIRFESTANKKNHFINFPNIEVKSKSYLALNSNAAATVEKVTTDVGAVFSIEGRYKTVDKIGGGTTNRAVEYGHLIMNDTPELVYDLPTVKPDYQTKYSYHMLDLQLYDYNDPAGTNNAPTIPGLLEYDPVNLSGITSPFSKLSKDYFFFHTIFSPSKLWDSDLEADVNPKGSILPGEGYVVAMNLSDFDWDLIERNWDIERKNRASGGFQFSTLFLDKKEGFIVGNRNIGEPLPANYLTEAEYLNHLSPEAFLDVKQSISVPIKSNPDEQKFFLANPFMAPLDLGKIVTTDGGSERPFGLKVGSTFNDSEIRNKFWILNESALSYNSSVQKNFYKLHYYSNVSAGNTAFLEKPSNDQYLIAPLQVFVLQTGLLAEAGNSVFKFETDKLTHGTVVATKNNSEIVDELLIQVINEDTGAEDRHAIVLSNKAKAESDEKTGDVLDDEKDDLYYKFKVGKETITEQREGAVYTKSSNNKAMRTNAVPLDTKKLPLYISPTETPQKMVLRPYRLTSLYSVEGVWLEDKVLNTVTKMTPEMEYPFESTVRTDKNAQGNRFVLHFAKVDEDDWYKETLTPISCYYNSSILYIMGLNEEDINSNVEIFDLQGRLIGRTKINIIPRMEYPIPVVSGTYIVKITGKRNFTTKFLSTQN